MYGKVYTSEERRKISESRKETRIADDKTKFGKIAKWLNACKIVLSYYIEITDGAICQLKRSNIRKNAS